MIRLRMMRLAGHAERMWQKRSSYRILVREPEERRQLEGQDLDGWIILKWYEQDLSGTGYGQVEDPCEDGNEPSGSIKCWEVLHYLYNWRLLNKGSAP
jgi:hypothetical protein